MMARRPQGGSFRPRRAPTWPPMIAPAAISAAAVQSMCVAMMKTTAATPLTMQASTFLTALIRCKPSLKVMPNRPSSKMPCAAPKYPP